MRPALVLVRVVAGLEWLAAEERIALATGGRYHLRRGGVVPPGERAEWRVVLDEQATGLGRGWRVEARYDVAVAGRHPVIVVAEVSPG